jgi:hypothetical protein
MTRNILIIYVKSLGLGMKRIEVIFYIYIYIYIERERERERERDENILLFGKSGKERGKWEYNERVNFLKYTVHIYGIITVSPPLVLLIC